MGLSQSPTLDTVPLNKPKDPLSSVFILADDLGCLADFYVVSFFNWSDSRHLHTFTSQEENKFFNPSNKGKYTVL
jgi:hypothetical protein